MMKYFWLSMLLLVAGIAAAQDSGKHEILIQRPWKVGSVMEATLDIETKIAITSVADGRVQNQTTLREYHLQCRLKVRAANDAGQWTQLSVVPQKLELKTSSNASDKVNTSKFSALGEVILVTRKDNAVIYKRADGLGLTLSDERLLKSFFSSPSKITPDDSFGPGKAVAVDDKWSVNAEELANLFNETITLIQVDPKNVSGKLQLVEPEEARKDKLLMVQGDIELKQLKVAPRVANVESGNAQARMKIEYMLPRDPKLPRRSAVMDFSWSISGPVKGKPAARLAMQHRTVKRETLKLLQEAKVP